MIKAIYNVPLGEAVVYHGSTRNGAWNIHIAMKRSRIQLNPRARARMFRAVVRT